MLKFSFLSLYYKIFFFLGYASNLSNEVFRLGKKYEPRWWLDVLGKKMQPCMYIVIAVRDGTPRTKCTGQTAAQ